MTDTQLGLIMVGIWTNGMILHVRTENKDFGASVLFVVMPLFWLGYLVYAAVK